MSGSSVSQLIEQVEHMKLEDVRAIWKRRYGDPPCLQSLPIMRMMLAWRLQADELGGLDKQTRRALANSGSPLALCYEGLVQIHMMRYVVSGETKEMNNSFDEFECGEFVPVAYFDSYMDCIRVVTLDRSITEERLDGDLTLYRTNHAGPFDPKYCGFCLKGIRHLLDELGLEKGAEISLTRLIDEIVKANPSSVVAKFLVSFPANDDILIEWEDRAAA
jgi:hypothetical protein